jgi:hypothetical protein
MIKSTVSVISRIHIGELPYVNAFIAHYKRIGVDSIYLIITKPNELELIKNYLQMAGSFIKYTCVELKPGESISMDNMNHILQDINEDYLLHIDIDEFLDVSSIKEVITSENADKIHFPWAITVNDGVSDIAKACYGMTHRNKPYKTLCKKDKIVKFISNGHDFETLDGVKEIISSHLLIHYWGRTFEDILLKALYANGFNNAKNSTISEVMTAVADNNINLLPNRLKMFAVLSRLEKTIHLDKDYSLRFIDKTKEAELLSALVTNDQRDKLYAKYTKFRSALDYEKQVRPYYNLGLLGFNWAEMKV